MLTEAELMHLQDFHKATQRKCQELARLNGAIVRACNRALDVGIIVDLLQERIADIMQEKA